MASSLIRNSTRTRASELAILPEPVQPGLESGFAALQCPVEKPAQRTLVELEQEARVDLLQHRRREDHDVRPHDLAKIIQRISDFSRTNN